MESITIAPAPRKIKWPGKEGKLNKEAYDLLGQINTILELIIINTLQYNKLTIGEEILEKLISVHYVKSPEMEIDIDLERIENICNALCADNGVLVKLVKNNTNYYKLNHKKYM
jgi:hypothetical protein